ncbi:hypothetical protein EV182_003355, partial [Spiromyces aspiralis]
VPVSLLVSSCQPSLSPPLLPMTRAGSASPSTSALLFVGLAQPSSSLASSSSPYS